LDWAPCCLARRRIGKVLGQLNSHQHAMVDIAMKEQGGSPDHIEVLDRIQPPVHRFEAFLPAQIIDGIDSREALGPGFDNSFG